MKYIITLLISSFALAKINVITTTPDLAALVKIVAQDQAEVFSIAKGTQDPHSIEAKPSFMIKLRDSQLIISQGLELESAWLNPLIQGSRNTKLAKLELGADLNPIEIPTGKVSRSDGDVHPGGNPHFQLDPIRLGTAAELIAQKLAELSPEKKDFFIKNAEDFQKLMEKKTKEWLNRIKKTGVKEIVTYHKSLAYFCHRFEIKCELQLEPKPGIPPTTSHLLEVSEQVKKRQIHMAFIENLYDVAAAEKIKTSNPSLNIAKVPISVEGEPEIKTNEELIEFLVKALELGSSRWK